MGSTGMERRRRAQPSTQVVTASWYWYRTTLRRRWRAWLGIALLIGLFAGVVTAAAAGARRTDSAYRRLLQANNSADIRIEDFIPNPEVAVVTPQAVEGIPDAAEANSFRVYQNAQDLAQPNYNASDDGRAFGTGLSRLKLLSGREARPDQPGEAMADFTARLHVGQHVSLPLTRSLNGDSHTPDDKAPSLMKDVTIVGIVAAPTQFPPYNLHSYYAGPSIYLTPAFYRSVGNQAVALDMTLLRTKPGRSAAAESELQALGNGKAVPSTDMSQQAHEVDRSIHLEAIAVWLLAGLLGLVLVLVVSQLLARQAFLEGVDDPTLTALGMTGAQVTVGALARGLVISTAAAMVAVATAVALSPLAPIGLARTADPGVGVNVDGPVLGAAALVVIVLVTALTVWSAALVGRRTRGAAEAAPGRPSALASIAVAAGLPPTATSGVRMALERGRGSTAVPVWSSLFGAIIGIAALVAALTFGSGLTHLLHTPRLYGSTWSTEIFNNNGPSAVPPGEAVVRADDDVQAAAYIQTGMNFRFEGRDVSGVAYQDVKGKFPLSILDGVRPSLADEVVLGSKTSSTFHAGVGSILTGIAEREQANPVPVRVVGRAVLPPGDALGRLGQGVIVTRAGILRLAGGKVRTPYIIAVQFRPGVDEKRAEQRLTSLLTNVDPAFFLVPTAKPNDLVNFGRIQNLPLILGFVLALLAAITLIHLLSTSTRRRRRDLAILKTLGFVRGQVARTVAWQATTLAVVAVVLGVPVGVAIGRVAWRAFAQQLGVVPQVVTPVAAVLLVVPATMALANLVAVVPAALAARTRTATVLRSE